MNSKAFALSSTAPMHGNTATLTHCGPQSDTEYEFREFMFASSGNSRARQNDVKHIWIRGKWSGSSVSPPKFPMKLHREDRDADAAMTTFSFSTEMNVLEVAEKRK